PLGAPIKSTISDVTACARLPVSQRWRSLRAEESRSASAPDNRRPCAPAAPAPHNARKTPLRLKLAGAPGSRPMPQTQSKFFDDLSRLMTDAAGVADGARREAQTFARAQMERMMAGMNVVAREEFEEMAAKARDENEKLAARVAALEAKLAEPKP